MSKKNQKKKKKQKQAKFVQTFPPCLFAPDGQPLHKSGVSVHGFQVMVVEE